jgi:hypothetical protein
MKNPFGSFFGDTAAKLVDSIGSVAGRFITTEKDRDMFTKEITSVVNDLRKVQEVEATKIVEVVNATMQGEGKSEHWLQWSWRPCVAFMAICVCLANYVLFPLLKLPAVSIGAEFWIFIGAVLGLASAGRMMSDNNTSKKDA